MQCNEGEHDWRATFDEGGVPIWFYCTKCRAMERSRIPRVRDE